MTCWDQHICLRWLQSSSVNLTIFQSKCMWILHIKKCESKHLYCDGTQFNYSYTYLTIQEKRKQPKTFALGHQLTHLISKAWIFLPNDRKSMMNLWNRLSNTHQSKSKWKQYIKLNNPKTEFAMKLQSNRINKNYISNPRFLP